MVHNPRHEAIFSAEVRVDQVVPSQGVAWPPTPMQAVWGSPDRRDTAIEIMQGGTRTLTLATVERSLEPPFGAVCWLHTGEGTPSRPLWAWAPNAPPPEAHLTLTLTMAPLGTHEPITRRYLLSPEQLKELL